MAKTFTMSLAEVREVLEAMQNDPTMITDSAYSPDTEKWPDNRIPFVEIHMAYLKSHKHVDPEHYLSNLRLMIRKTS